MTSTSAEPARRRHEASRAKLPGKLRLATFDDGLQVNEVDPLLGGAGRERVRET